MNTRKGLASKVFVNGEARELSFFIPGKIPRFNEMIDSAKRKIPWLSKGKVRVDEYTVMKKEWTRYIEGIIRDGVGNVQFEAAQVEFFYVEENRKHDPDNFTGANRKFIIDALRDAGIIKNDGWKQIKPPFRDDWKKGDTPGVLVTVKECPAPD